MSAWKPASAMVLSAGLGKRMRPITDTLPKPLVEVAGKPLIDWALDALAEAGVERAVVNIHHLGAQIAGHLAGRRTPEILLSDESDRLLDSAGGIVKALPLLGGEPFYVLNADTFWIDHSGSNLARLAACWNDATMDILLMLVEPRSATGHGEGTDFLMDFGGRIARSRGARDGLIYAGAAILHPRALSGGTPEPHSLNAYFDRAIAEGRLYGMAMEGHWITVGTPDAIADAEAAVARELDR